jgi:GWxTD domain-containing protein
MLAVAAAVHAQLIVPRSPFLLNVDYARFQQDSQSGYLELYYGFYPKLVTLQASGGTFRGGIQLRTLLTNASTGEVLRNEHALLPVSVADTSDRATRNSIVTQAGVILPFGTYRLRVTASDSLTPARRDSIELMITLDPPSTALAISDLELCSEIKSSTNTSDPFYKNSLEVIPHPPLVFGVTSAPVVFKYAELYNVRPQQPYTLSTQIVDAAGNVVREASKSRSYTGGNAVEVGTTNVTSIASGRYTYVFRVSDAGGAEVARSEKTFYIYNPHIQPTPASAVVVKSAELAGLSAEELAEEFRQAQYYATDEEIRTFARLTDAGARREFLAKFWVEVEKGRMDRPPMRRTDYLRRISIANERYRSQAREGWRTDRGRVFMLYGEPDAIERFPSSTENKPYEIWHYYQIESGVQFVFVDRTGFSEFVLVHSTKRGEFRDDTWQRMLQ